MTEFLKKKPIALRHCLLYVFLQEKTVEIAFDGFCRAVGYVFIEKEEFRFWFDQFEKGIIYLEEQPVADLKEFIRSDKHALRVCVLYEWLIANSTWPEGEPFAKYIHFCEVIGDDVMDNQHFNFWFYRFENGEFNLDFERDKDEKIYELTDMPIDIMRNIVEYLDIVDRSSLEKASVSLRLFSRDQKLFHRYLEFNVYKDSARICCGLQASIRYANQGSDCVVEFRDRKKVIHDANVLKQAFRDFKKILENPKLYLDTLNIMFYCEDSESLGKSIEDALKFTHLLHVKHISLRAESMKTFLNILPSLKPGYLTKISINIDVDDDVIGKMIGTEQWKQAKYFRMSPYLYLGRLRHLFHFHEFTANRYKLSVEDVREMKEILFKSPDFERCHLHFRHFFDHITIRREFGVPIERRDEIWHYPIPDSTDYFEILFINSLIKIERKKK